MKKILMTIFVLPLLLAGCYGENDAPEAGNNAGDRATMEPQRQNMDDMSDPNSLNEQDDPTTTTPPQ